MPNQHLNVKALVGTFNQVKALVRVSKGLLISVNVKIDCEVDGSLAALVIISPRWYTDLCRHYVHCINEWVSAEPSNLRIQCLDDLDITSIPGIIPKGQGQQFTETDRDREEKLANQQNLDIDPRLLP